MIFAILIYGSEADYAADVSAEENDALMNRHWDLRRALSAEDRLGPVVRLRPHAVRTVRRYKDRRFVTDGPFTETKEQLMGIYVVDYPTIEDVDAAIDQLDFPGGVFEVRPLDHYEPGQLPAEVPARYL